MNAWTTVLAVFTYNDGTTGRSWRRKQYVDGHTAPTWWDDCPEWPRGPALHVSTGVMGDQRIATSCSTIFTSCCREPSQLRKFCHSAGFRPSGLALNQCNAVGALCYWCWVGECMWRPTRHKGLFPREVLGNYLRRQQSRGKGSSFPFSKRCLKNRCSYRITSLTCGCSTMSPGNPFVYTKTHASNH